MVNWVIVGLLTMPMIANSVQGIIAPFFPAVADSKGISGQVKGLIFSAFPVAATIASPLVGEYINRFGRRKFLVLGGLVIVRAKQATSLFLFANMPEYPYGVFIAIGLIARFLQGVGGGMIGTSALSIIAVTFPARLEVLIGAMQSLNGVGMMLGPLVGSVIFKFFGFTVLFCSFGVMFLVYLPLCYLLLPQDVFKVSTRQQVRLIELLSLRVSLTQKVYMNSVLIIVSFSALGFIEPTLCGYLEDFDLSQVGCGLVFTLPTVVYALSVGVINQLCKTIDRRVVMLIGVSLVSFGLMLLGPWTYTFLPKSLYTTLFGTAVVGAGLAFSMLPSMPDMLNEALVQLPSYAKEQLSDKISGIINTSFYLGKAIGPPLGGLLTDYFGFRSANAVYAGVMLSFAMFYGLFNRAFWAMNEGGALKKEALLGSELISTKLLGFSEITAASEDV
jgi:MFS family permease